MSTSRSSNWRIRSRLVAVSLSCGILLWDATAYAVNAIFSQDLPVLTQIALQEAANHTELVAILAEAAAIVEQVKEYTTLTKTVYRGIEELATMDIEDVKEGVALGLNNAYPEIAHIRADIADIRDLRYSDPAAVSTLRGILWEEVYGPTLLAIQNNAEENLETAAEVEERKATHHAYIETRRRQWDKWQDTCEDGAAGACQRAANAAAVEQTQLLGDIHESVLYSVQMQSREQLREDRREVEQANTALYWLSDVEAYIASFSGAKPRCRAGKCLSERYRTKPEDYTPQRRDGRERSRRERGLREEK